MMEDAGTPIFARIIRLLPILMIGLLIMGMIMFASTSIVPRWRAHEDARVELEIANAALAERAAAEDNDNQTILESQIERAASGLDEAIARFMSVAQADDLLDNLYIYANRSGVQITNLQAQQAAPVAAESEVETSPQPISSVYQVQSFSLLVDGSVPGLMRFMTEIREAALPGIVITNVNLTAGAEQSTLTLFMLIYSSERSAGETYLDLPSVAIPPALVVVLDEPIDPLVTPGAETPVPPPSVLPELPPDPPLALLLDESFDSGDLSNWTLGASWFLTNEGGGQALAVTDSASETLLAYDGLREVAVQFRVWMETGGVRLSLHQSSAGRYAITLNALGLVALYEGERLVQSSASTVSGMTRWRTLRVTTLRDIIRVYVDDVEILRYATSSPLPPGTISLAMTGRGTVKVDDLAVWILDSAQSS
ncbi:MAG: hypothetical protein JNJ61_27915 [Anaerolineae bacterium]|nr:hypothetical protein [Anaerolineae bacterium]